MFAKNAHKLYSIPKLASLEISSYVFFPQEQSFSRHFCIFGRDCRVSFPSYCFTNSILCFSRCFSYSFESEAFFGWKDIFLPTFALLYVCSGIPILVVLEFYIETGCSVPRQDLCGFAGCTLLYVFLSTNQFLAPIPKGNLLVGISPTHRCRNTRERVVDVLAWIPTIWANNVFPSFAKGMWLESSFQEFPPVLFCRGNHVFVHFKDFFPLPLWHTLAPFVVQPNIIKVAALAKQASWEVPRPSPFSSSYGILHLHSWTWKHMFWDFRFWKNT